MSLSKSASLNRCLTLSLFAGVGLYLVFWIMDYNNWFVHPHSFEIQLYGLLPDGLNFRWSDWIRPFAHLDLFEDRPRFLSYFVTLIDYRLRLMCYEHFVLFPPFSIAWFLTLGVAPVLVLRCARNMGLDGQTAALATLLYVTSTGFLSGFSMILMSAKPLSNVVYIGVIYLMSELKLKYRDQLFYEIKSPLKTALSILIFLGLFVDEMSLFVFILLPVLFQEMFEVRQMPGGVVTGAAKRMLKNVFGFLAPFLLFLFVMIFLVPILTQHYFQYKFDYLGSILSVKKEMVMSGKTLFHGKLDGFGWHSFLENFMTLLGVSFVPGQISPFITHPAASGVLSGQSQNLPQMLILLAVFAGIGVILCQASGERKSYLKRLVLLCVIYTLFVSLLLGRHVVYVTGYYYATAFGLFLAYLVAFCLGEINRFGEKFKWLSMALAALIVVIQINNFSVLNRSYITFHNEEWIKNAFSPYFQIIDKRALTRKELNEIWSAWKERRLEDYLRRHGISAGAVFLVVELMYRDELTKKK